MSSLIASPPSLGCNSLPLSPASAVALHPSPAVSLPSLARRTSPLLRPLYLSPSSPAGPLTPAHAPTKPRPRTKLHPVLALH